MHEKNDWKDVHPSIYRGSLWEGEAGKVEVVAKWISFDFFLRRMLS